MSAAKLPVDEIGRSWRRGGRPGKNSVDIENVVGINALGFPADGGPSHAAVAGLQDVFGLLDLAHLFEQLEKYALDGENAVDA